MPLTRNKINHIKRLYRRAWKHRTVAIELRFVGGRTRLVQGIWHNLDTADPDMASAPGAATPSSIASADAAFEVLTDDISIGELQAVTSVRPSSYEDVEFFGLASSYLIVQIQPKGMAWPANRAYVLLRRA